MKKVFLAFFALVAITMVADVASSGNFTGNIATAAAAPRNDGSYTRTSRTVTIVSENGNPKGTFHIYLHHGKKYIQFQNDWVCIEGKRRFSHNGNWYVIK